MPARLSSPLSSAVALARFELLDEHLDHAIKALEQETEWQEWLNQIELNGLSGFANKHVDQHGLPIPEQVRMPLKALKVRHTAAAKARYKTLVEIGNVFSEHGVSYAALKGVALMPLVYKEAYLRPMRDMDLLLPQLQEQAAGDCLRQIGFDLPESQPSAFMKGVHQLPNATKTINGMISSVELHHNGLAREVPENVFFPEHDSGLQTVMWDALEFKALDDVTMLHQVTRHCEALHPGGVMKLINAMDVILLSQRVLNTGQWPNLQARYPHVINTLRCLHLLTPLPADLAEHIGDLPTHAPSGVGQIMVSLSTAFAADNKVETLRLLFAPSDWWLHMFYHVHPKRSLWWVKCVRHPWRVGVWLWQRVYSRVRGG